jgi:hypothetical protein
MFRVKNLVSEQKCHRFDALRPAVDVIAEKQEFAIGRMTNFGEDSEKIVKLSVDVTNDVERWRKMKKKWLLQNNSFRKTADNRNTLLRDPKNWSRLAILFVKKPPQDSRDFLRHVRHNE